MASRPAREWVKHDGPARHDGYSAAKAAAVGPCSSSAIGP